MAALLSFTTIVTFLKLYDKLRSSICFNRAMKAAGLWSMWLPGLILVSISLYATQRLPSLANDHGTTSSVSYLSENDGGGGITRIERLPPPNITIFTAPRPFVGSVGDRQALAVRSWLGLSPWVDVVLFGDHPSIVSFAASLGSRVLVESDIDFSFLGTPFFHSMVARSLASSSDISVIMDPETIIFPDFISTLNFAHQLDQDWFLYALSTGVSDFPFRLDSERRNWLWEGDEGIKLQEFISQKQHSNNCSDGHMLLAWSNNKVPLHMGVLPPFLYGKGFHNNWLINEVIHSNFRFVIDASWTILNIYFIVSDDHQSGLSAEDSPVTQMQKNSWEYDGNLHLGTSYGQLYFHEANFNNIVKLAKCHGDFMFVHAVDDFIPVVHQRLQSSWKEFLLTPGIEKKIADCHSVIGSLASFIDCSITSNLSLSVPSHLPFDLESILPLVADKTKTIVLAVAGYSYKEMLMSWVCRLRRLRINNFLVWALDDDMYRFSLLQGLPVLRDHSAPNNISFNDCHFGTKCFQKVTKRKSSLVLQILKLGYNVLLSDVDVYWFKNPIKLLQSFGPRVLSVQSDEYNITGPINVPRRLNSGFYFARSDDSTIIGFEKIAKHAMNSELSEQPSFYDILCGKHGEKRVGDDKCWDTETSLTVQFMDRELFPNGAYKGLWNKRNIRAACAKMGCYILHNNWISGRKKKLSRQLASGLWDYDVSSRMCLQKWH